ncbi:ABC transporter ATP-binding protein [Cellulomonas cellasea]|uniref:ABC transporter ATP-binding protein n=1 Tax=Cellulomonas cellasea TaxID=43670 RepID=UPI0025A3AE67|nr:ABC transporter ATP-binding protein [Cellulomonas cellasea]MDM8084820.1 ABC transporter ATP-binding protein [Cellulomonas cellasea]
MSADVLAVDGITRRFGAVVANDRVTLRVRAGEVVGLLGHNGAGKTTLVSQVVGLLRPDSGAIRVGDVDAVADPAGARRRVALQAQAQAPINGLTPRTAIELAGRIRGLSPRRARAAAEELAAELDILPWIDQKALPDGGGLSGGVRRLTSFAMTVVAPTPLVVLDEPTNDIDASRRRRLWDAVRRIGDEGAGVLLVTHNVVEAERVVDELVVLDRGKVVAAGSPAALRGSQDTDLRLELQLHPGGADPSEVLAEVPVPVARRVRTGRRVLLTVPAAQAAAAVAWANGLREKGALDGYALAPATLEDAYLAVTTSESTDEADASDEPTASDEAATEEPSRA